MAVFQKEIWYSGIKVYNQLPPTLKQQSHDVLKLKMALKIFLLANCFYTWTNIIAGNKDLDS